jgi:hypothetical protein
MVKHTSAIGPKAQLDQYSHTVDEVLDQYKQGKINATEAHQNHDEAVALLVQALYSIYLIRMRNIEAFRTPVGETFVERRAK